MRRASPPRRCCGRLDVLNPIAPQLFHRLVVRADGRRRRERVPGETSYTHQLRAFVRHVREGVPMLSDASDAVADMRVIDTIYAAAGLPRRGLSGRPPGTALC